MSATHIKNLPEPSASEETALFKDIVRAVVFTNDQHAMLDYHRKEQYAMERKQLASMCLSQGIAGCFLILLVAQTYAMVGLYHAWNHRFDYIEQRLQQEQQVQPKMSQPRSDMSREISFGFGIFPEVQRDAVLLMCLKPRRTLLTDQAFQASQLVWIKCPQILLEQENQNFLQTSDHLGQFCRCRDILLQRRFC